MKKLALTPLLIIAAFNTQSHEFLTEILTQQNSSYTTNYVPVASYQLTKSEILEISQNGTQIDYYKTRDKSLLAVPRKTKLNNCSNQKVASTGSDMTNIIVEATCGQFDNFSHARAAAVTTCYNLDTLSAGVYPSVLVPLYLAPSTFVNYDTASPNHHQSYDLNDGLTFKCVYQTKEVN